jgi:hypothetical protein
MGIVTGDSVPLTLSLTQCYTGLFSRLTAENSGILFFPIAFSIFLHSELSSSHLAAWPRQREEREIVKY